MLRERFVTRRGAGRMGSAHVLFLFNEGAYVIMIGERAGYNNEFTMNSLYNKQGTISKAGEVPTDRHRKNTGR